LRTRSVGTKVSKVKLHVLESRTETTGLTLSEWVRDVPLGWPVDTGKMDAERAILAEMRASIKRDGHRWITHGQSQLSNRLWSRLVVAMYV
jgi:hypothetical protein